MRTNRAEAWTSYRETYSRNRDHPQLIFGTPLWVTPNNPFLYSFSMILDDRMFVLGPSPPRVLAGNIHGMV